MEQSYSDKYSFEIFGLDERFLFMLGSIPVKYFLKAYYQATSDSDLEWVKGNNYDYDSMPLKIYLMRRFYEIFYRLSSETDLNNPNFEFILTKTILEIIRMISSFNEDSISIEELTFLILDVFKKIFFSKENIKITIPIYLYGQMIRIFKSNKLETDLSSEAVSVFSRHLSAIESLRKRQDDIGVIARIIHDSLGLELNQLEDFFNERIWQFGKVVSDSCGEPILPPSLKERIYKPIH